MRLLRRTVSALAVVAGLAGAGALGGAPALLAPLAAAQDLSSAEGRLKAVIAAQGIPENLVSWASVEDAGAGGLIARGVTVDLTPFNIGLTTLPLGDFEVTELTFDGGYVARLKGRFSGITMSLADLMAAGQAMGGTAAQNPAAGQTGMGLAMVAGFVQGIGYQSLTLAIDLDQTIDLAAGTMDYAMALDVAEAFKATFDVDMTGVTAAYLDWARENGMKMYMASSPEALAAAEAAMSDPNGPLAGVGFARYAIGFDDQGLMPRLEPQLAMARQSMLGVNEDGSPKTELSDDDLRAQAAGMAAGSPLSADALMPVIRAIYGFVMKPDVITLSAAFNPPMTLGEIMTLSNPAAPQPAAPIDWNSRVTLDGSN